MRRPARISALLLTVVFVLGMFCSAAGAAMPLPVEKKVDVLIGFAGKPDKQLVKQFGGEVVREYKIVDAVAARLPEKAVNALAKNPRVAYVEPDAAVYALEALPVAAGSVGAASNDTAPWGVDRVFGAEVYPFITTWDVSKKGAGISVAVLDTGIDKNHGELNVAGGTTTVDDTDWGSDVHSHGTHVAGTIAALFGNGGIVGVAPGVDLYSVKVLSDSGIGSISSVVAGIDWSVSQGIKVLNMSLGSSSDSTTLRNSCANAYNKGHLIVAAAGNSGNPGGTGNNVNFPARYDTVIAVAASDINNKRASFSSTGPAVELIAPGVSITSTVPGGGYGFKSGTSMASPHAAGVAALTWAANSQLTNVQIRQILRDTAQDLKLSASHQGYGLARADRAVAAAAALLPEQPLPPQPEYGSITGTVKGSGGEDISGATVGIAGAEYSTAATTGSNGNYTVNNVPVGTYQVTASKEGYESQTFNNVAVSKDTTVTLNFTLTQIPPTYTVSGTVTGEGGTALQGATVSIAGTGKSAVTNSSGSYSIAGVTAGTYNVTANATGYESQTKQVSVAGNTVINFTLTEITQDTMHVSRIIFEERRYGSNVDLVTTVEVVRSSNGDPVPNARVSLNLRSSRVNANGTATTDSNGRATFTLRRAAKGTYTATVTGLTHSVYTWDKSKGVTSESHTIR